MRWGGLLLLCLLRGALGAGRGGRGGGGGAPGATPGLGVQGGPGCRAAPALPWGAVRGCRGSVFWGISVPPEPAGARPAAPHTRLRPPAPRDRPWGSQPPPRAPPCPSTPTAGMGCPDPPICAGQRWDSGEGLCPHCWGVPTQDPPTRGTPWHGWRCPGSGCSPPGRFWGAFGGGSLLSGTPHTCPQWRGLGPPVTPPRDGECAPTLSLHPAQPCSPLPQFPRPQIWEQNPAPGWPRELVRQQLAS